MNLRLMMNRVFSFALYTGMFKKKSNNFNLSYLSIYFKFISFLYSIIASVYKYIIIFAKLESDFVKFIIYLKAI